MASEPTPVEMAQRLRDAFVRLNTNLDNLDNDVDAMDLVLLGKANTIHSHDGADVTSGTVSVARIGTGTKDTTTVYHGDGTFRVPVGGGTGTTDIDGGNATSTYESAAVVDGGGA